MTIATVHYPQSTIDSGVCTYSHYRLQLVFDIPLSSKYFYTCTLGPVTGTRPTGCNGKSHSEGFSPGVQTPNTHIKHLWPINSSREAIFRMNWN